MLMNKAIHLLESRFRLSKGWLNHSAKWHKLLPKPQKPSRSAAHCSLTSAHAHVRAHCSRVSSRNNLINTAMPTGLLAWALYCPLSIETVCRCGICCSAEELEEATGAEAAAVEAEDFERAAALSATADAGKARLAGLQQAVRAVDSTCERLVQLRPLDHRRERAGCRQHLQTLYSFRPLYMEEQRVQL